MNDTGKEKSRNESQWNWEVAQTVEKKICAHIRKYTGTPAQIELESQTGGGESSYQYGN